MLFEEEVNKMNELSDREIKQLLKIEAAKHGINMRKLSKIVPCSWSYLYKCLDSDFQLSPSMKLRFVCFLVRQRMKN